MLAVVFAAALALNADEAHRYPSLKLPSSAAPQPATDSPREASGGSTCSPRLEAEEQDVSVRHFAEFGGAFGDLMRI